MGLFDQNSPGILGKASQWMTPERGLAISALGQGISQLSAGQPVDLSDARNALMMRQQRAQQEQALNESGLLQQFTPQQQAILAQMEPSAAQKVIASVLFAPPKEGPNLQTFNGPDGTVYQFNPQSGEAKPLTGGKPADPLKRAVMIGPDDPRRAELGLPDDGKAYEVEYSGDTPVDFSVPGGAGVNVSQNVQNSPVLPGQEALDKAYAEEYMRWLQGGGADASSQAAQISSVLSELEQGKELTGPMIGIQGDFVRAVLNPEAQDAKERVESVVQRSLKETLGAQFTEKEGERLISRSYNINMKPEQNAARLRALYQQLESAAKAKAAMAEHFAENGTLAGMKRVKIPTIDDMLEAMDKAAPFVEETGTVKPGTVEDGFRFIGGDPSNPDSWEKVD